MAALLLLTGCARTSLDRWVSPLGRVHPLAGRIWDVAAQRFIDAPTLVTDIERYRFVLLGEKHDNADHHRLQARILAALVAAGHRPAIVFEMLSADVAPALAGALARSDVTLPALRAAVAWDRSGWPPWPLYAPIFAEALRARLPIGAGDLPRAAVSDINRGGLGALKRGTARRLAAATKTPETVRAAIAEEIREAHCGHVSPRVLERMVDAQIARDAHLARALVDALDDTGTSEVILIAGIGHVRRDRAVPARLRHWAPDSSMAIVAFLEVDAEHTNAIESLRARYNARPPFDYIWFTPRVDDDDPCAKFEKQLDKLSHHPAGKE